MTLTGNRKFILASAATIGSFVLAWRHGLSGGEWVTVVGVILSAHGVANVVDKKLGGAG